MARAVRADAFSPLGALCSPECTDALRWYTWEVNIAAAFFTLLRHLERTLGHALSEQLTVRFGREDWWDHPAIGLHHASRRKIEEILAKLARDHRRAVTAEAVQRELTLGFWVSLLGPGNDYETRLWRPTLRHAFPAYRGPRRPLHRDLDHLRTLRNKVAHHEPIGLRDLAADRRSAYRILGYLSADVLDWVAAEDQIPQLLTERPASCAQVLPDARREL
ncbi:hypothetical protein PV356_18130 [Streptomyces sp. WI03-5b]|uniref:hypothetical protein n=1 Tax=Streptomyces sp. WI03-5b TaxID=462946 RepID=UPI0029AD03B4|nr:hypothetical protein [Streptomyces sp. WI03-5b]MDX2621425.1 hypothetical protein [Streptomyces sp. WI03-5b]